MVQFLSDDDGVIVTIYFLNQVAEPRQFETYEEFVRLRDEFVRGYAECAAASRARAKQR